MSFTASCSHILQQQQAPAHSVLVASTALIAELQRDALARSGTAWLGLRCGTPLSLARELIDVDLLRSGERSTNLASSFVAAACIDCLRPPSPFAALSTQAGLHRCFDRAIRDLDHAGVETAQLLPANASEQPRLHALQAVWVHMHEEARRRGLLPASATLRRATEAARRLDDTARPRLLIARAEFDALPPLERTFLEVLAPNTLTVIEEETTAAARVDFRPALTPEHEARAAMRDILHRRIPLDQVEIVYCDSYQRALIWELCQEFDLPVTFAEGIPLHYSKATRTVLRFLQWIERGDAHFLIRLLYEGIANFQPFTVDGVSANRLPAAELLRRAAIGPDPYRTVERVDRYLARGAGAGNPAWPACRELIAAFAALLPERRADGFLSLHTLVEHIATLLRDLCRPAFPGEPQAVAQLHDVLEDFARGPELLAEPAFVLAMITDSISATSMPVVLKEVGGTAEQSSMPLPGHLYVCDIRHAGWTGRPSVYVLGVDADSMPGKAEINPVLLDEDREHVAQRLGVTLPDALARVRRRAGDFRALTRRVRGALTLSWARLDTDKLHSLAPSRELLALFRSVHERPDADYGEFERAMPPAEGDVPAEWPLSLAEYFLHKAGRRTRADALDTLLARYPLQRAGQEALELRDSPRFTAFDGFVGRHSPEDNHTFALSPSTLEALSRCPYKTFLQKFLRLEAAPTSEFDASEWMNPAELGSCAHTLFKEFTLRRLREGWPEQHWEREAQALIDEVLAQYVDHQPAPNQAALRHARGALQRIITMFLRLEARQPELRILGVELSIAGDEDVPAPLHRPDTPPLLRTPAGDVLLRGRMDRVDMDAAGRLRIVDYKTGSMKSARQRVLREGLLLQPGLYATALRAMLPGSERTDLRFSYIHLSDKEQGVEVPYAVDDPGLAETVSHLLRAWREGVFPHAVEAGACTFCEFRELCGPPQRVCAQSQMKLDNADNSMLDAWRELQHD